MKAFVLINQMNRGRGPSPHAVSIAQGLCRHGIEVTHIQNEAVDFAVSWGWRRAAQKRLAGFAKPILVMERGFLGDRFHWTSLGWDGLNGRARWNGPQDGGERFWKNFGHLACEWERHDGYALVIGQVEGDMALANINVRQWYREVINNLDRRGWDVRFRPHPEAVRRHQRPMVPDYMVMTDGTLQDAFADAGIVVTYNSNTGVESVLAGIPTYAYDEGSMAFDMAAHHLAQEPVTPDRNEWFRAMAWKQWAPDELSSGAAWEVVKEAM